MSMCSQTFDLYFISNTLSTTSEHPLKVQGDKCFIYIVNPFLKHGCKTSYFRKWISSLSQFCVDKYIKLIMQTVTPCSVVGGGAGESR